MVEPEFHPAALAIDVPRDTVKAVMLNGVSLLLIHTEDGLYAIENRCSHAEEPLACGRVKYGWISCPAHGARFDLGTGEALTPPATAAIRTYPVRIDGDAISVALG
jgi:3-phenylpropionate/trans-cinnamate dioxygenase ferredoxin component